MKIEATEINLATGLPSRVIAVWDVKVEIRKVGDKKLRRTLAAQKRSRTATHRKIRHGRNRKI